jgi:membrane protein
MSSGSAAAAPTPWRQMNRAQWWRVARAMWDRFGEIQLTDRAAALTYYSVLSLFPGLLVAVALLALVGQYPETYQSIIDTLRDAAPGSAVETINSALRGALRNRGSAGPVLVVGLLIALYSASGAMGAAVRALESINRVRSGRSFLPNLRIRLGLTVGLMLLVLIAFLAVVVGGPLFGSVADAAGLSASVTDVVGYARWPVGALALLTAFTALYLAGPRKGPRIKGGIFGRRRLETVLPGAILGTFLWFVVSLGFTAYVSHFGSYDKTYGTLGALISLFVWLWLGNLAFLLGALFNAEALRVRGRR